MEVLDSNPSQTRNKHNVSEDISDFQFSWVLWIGGTKLYCLSIERKNYNHFVVDYMLL